MKKYTLLGTTLLLLTGISSFQPEVSSQRSTNVAELRISVPKGEFLMGEPVSLVTHLKNIGEFDFAVQDFSVAENWFKVYIANDGNEFKRFKFKCCAGIGQAVKPDEDHAFTTLVFFNSKPETERLSDYAIREKTDGMMLTDYAFPKPGTYRIRASVTPQRTNSSGSISQLEVVESNEITIKINQPEGDDLKVWNIIKSDIRLGAYMQLGRIWHFGSMRNLQEPNGEENLLKEIDKIVTEHANSYLARILSDKVAETRARREKGRIEKEKFDEKVKNYKDPRKN